MSADHLELYERFGSEPLLTPGEVAALFRVDPKTVTRWAQSGKLVALRTIGGHRRFLESQVRAYFHGQYGHDIDLDRVRRTRHAA